MLQARFHGPQTAPPSVAPHRHAPPVEHGDRDGGPLPSTVPAALVLRFERPADPIDVLLAGVARGDRHAFDRLHATTRPRLLALAERVLHNRAHAEEVVQESYLTIWQQAGRRRASGGSGIGWLNAIVRNRAIDRQRRLRGDPCLCMDVDWDVAETSEDERDERASAVAPLLDRLDPHHSAALRAAYFHDLSHREVAERLGVPLGTAKSWIRRGLAQMARLLEPAAL